MVGTFGLVQLVGLDREDAVRRRHRQVRLRQPWDRLPFRPQSTSRSLESAAEYSVRRPWTLSRGLQGAHAGRLSGTRSALRDDSRSDSRAWRIPTCCELATPGERWVSIASRRACRERMAFST